jgi:hypothetical protein
MAAVLLSSLLFIGRMIHSHPTTSCAQGGFGRCVHDFDAASDSNSSCQTVLDRMRRQMSLLTRQTAVIDVNVLTPWRVSDGVSFIKQCEVYAQICSDIMQHRHS